MAPPQQFLMVLPSTNIPQLMMDNLDLQSELHSHKLSADKQEQWSCRNAIHIRGLNENRDENTLGLVHTVCSDIGVALHPGDISISHCRPTGKRRQG